MKILLNAFVVFFLITYPLSGAIRVNRPTKDYCHVFGTVFIEKKKNMADYLVFIEKEEAFSDILVFKEDSRLYADKEGKWYITSNRGLADYTIYLEENRGSAHFTVFYTDVESFAGCR